MSLHVLAPGLLTTVQDAGRTGLRHLGVGSAGALDPFSYRAANLLVGNRRGEAALEITLVGPTLRFDFAARIALTGAECEAFVDDVPIPGLRRVDLPAGATLRIGPCRRGARAYLAVAGGIDVAPVLGSRATDLRAGFGGFAGRALRSGDVLPLDPLSDTGSASLGIASRWIDPRPTLDLSRDAVAQVLPGRDELSRPDALFDSRWCIAAASDRQVLRLEGPSLALAQPRECTSEPLVPGTIQLPPEGQPLLLLADAQTVGGYPVIGIVASADLARLAQCRPGESLHLRRGDRDAAFVALRAREEHLARIGIALDAAPPGARRPPDRSAR
jgi:biotin-dependent carboxylase-like uncharacterized protein